MLQFTDREILGWLAAVVFPFCRVAALITIAPIFGDSVTPARLKIALAAIITVMIAPVAGDSAAVTVMSAQGLMLIVRQMVIGLTMGFGVKVAFAAVQYGGDLIGLQMGLGFAQTYDPQHNAESPVIGNLLGYLTSLIFLAANGHLLLIAGLAQSFAVAPLMGAAPIHLDWQAISMQGATIFGLGLFIALPVIVAIFLSQVVLGVMMRSAPQMNLFSIGFPITLLLGMGALILELPTILPTIEKTVTASTLQLLGAAN